MFGIKIEEFWGPEGEVFMHLFVNDCVKPERMWMASIEWVTNEFDRLGAERCCYCGCSEDEHFGSPPWTNVGCSCHQCDGYMDWDEYDEWQDEMRDDAAAAIAEYDAATIVAREREPEGLNVDDLKAMFEATDAAALARLADDGGIC